MSQNAEVHIERKWLQREPSMNYPRLGPSPFTNDTLSILDYVNPSSLAQAGIYEKIVRLPEPIRPWHPASKGTTDEFEGCLTNIFPELRDLSEKELREIGKMRDRV